MADAEHAFYKQRDAQSTPAGLQQNLSRNFCDNAKKFGGNKGFPRRNSGNQQGKREPSTFDSYGANPPIGLQHPNRQASQPGKPNSGPRTSGPIQITKVPESRSDPLKLDTFVTDGANFAPMTIGRNILSETPALDAISGGCYRRLVASNPGFARRVCYSAYAWYNALLIYARMLSLHARNGFQISMSEIQFVNIFEPTSCVFDSPILRYAEGLGNISTVGGRSLLFRLANRELVTTGGCPGWFGRVGPNTHFLYTAYPCVAVYARRIMNDIVHEGIAPANWALPEAILPIEAGAGNATCNLLGYGQSMRLRPDAAAFLANCNINGADFNSSLDCVAYNRTLMSAVSSEISATSTFKPKAPSGFSPVGSKAQLGAFTVPDRTPFVNTGRYIDYNLVVKCSGAIENQLVGASMMYLYRGVRNNIEGRRCWSPYLFNNYQAVPNTWEATKDSLRTEAPTLPLYQNSMSFIEN